VATRPRRCMGSRTSSPTSQRVVVRRLNSWKEALPGSLASTTREVPLSLANWKMHLGPRDARSYFQTFHTRYSPWRAVTSGSSPGGLSRSGGAGGGRPFRLCVGAQDVYWDRGASQALSRCPSPPRRVPRRR
jgi:hypothetical protein